MSTDETKDDFYGRRSMRRRCRRFVSETGRFVALCRHPLKPTLSGSGRGELMQIGVLMSFKWVAFKLSEFGSRIFEKTLQRQFHQEHICTQIPVVEVRRNQLMWTAGINFIWPCTSTLTFIVQGVDHGNSRVTAQNNFSYKKGQFKGLLEVGFPISWSWALGNKRGFDNERY